MDYGRQTAVCPRCGSSAEVRTVGEMFDMLNGMQDQAMQQAQQQGQFPGQQPGPYQGQPGPYQGPQGRGEVYAGGYSEGASPGSSPYRNRPSYDSDSFTGDIGQDITSAVLGGVTGFLGRAMAKKVQKTIQERVVPAMQARAAAAQQQSQQARSEQAAIVQRYPDLRGCMKDQVVFLEGGSSVVPISEIRMPVTMQQADALVDRLRSSY